MMKAAASIFLYAVLILSNVGIVTGSFLRGHGDHHHDMRRILTDSTALKEGQTVTCYDREECVFRWTNGKLRGYPNTQIANSWKVRWRDEMAHVDCVHLPFGEDMPLKINEPVDDGTIVTCFGNEEKVYIIENGALRWFPSPQIAESWEHFWRPNKVVDCDVFPFGPDMAMKS